MQISIRVDVLWDEEAEVYVATSENVPGLVTEAKTFELLQERVVAVVPELLRDNTDILDRDVPDSVEMCVLSKVTQKVQLTV